MTQKGPTHIGTKYSGAVCRGNAPSFILACDCEACLRELIQHCRVRLKALSVGPPVDVSDLAEAGGDRHWTAEDWVLHVVGARKNVSTVDLANGASRWSARAIQRAVSRLLDSGSLVIVGWRPARDGLRRGSPTPVLRMRTRAKIRAARARMR